MTTNDQTQINATEAATRFLNTRREEVSQETVRNQTTPVNRFAEFIEEKDKQLPQLTGLDIQQFYDQLTVKKVSRRQYMVAVRQFIRYLERLDLTPKGLSEQVYVPSIDKNEWIRDKEIKPERVQATVQHLGKYRYASIDHLTMQLLWHTGIRVGALHSLDVDDFTEIDNQPVLKIRHRPDQGTRLKNKEDGQRIINLKPDVAETIQDYIEVNRKNQRDDYGREPLLASKYGRASKSMLRSICIYWTCPRVTGIDECECCDEEPTKEEAADCEMSRPPHTIRAASITYWRRQEIPAEAVSDRMNVGRDVIEKHYDRRTEEGKAKQRRQYLDSV